MRFPNPVTVGRACASHVTLRRGHATSPAGKQMVDEHTIEIEGHAKPACVAETVVLLLA